MSEWPAVVVPAVAVALVVRLDAKFVGPYFALSELVGASDSVTAPRFYESPTLRAALARRMLYPLIAGFLLAAVLAIPLSELAVVGLLAAGLLLWPILFQGLPHGVSKRDWELPVLYITFAGAYTGLALSGGLLHRLIVYVAEGDLRRWIADQFVASFAAWVVVLFLFAIYRAMFGRLSDKATRREAIGLEYDWDGGSAMLDDPPSNA